VGHVFVTLNGGRTWTNVSGNLPDAPANSSVIRRGKLVVGTDVGILATPFAGPGNWAQVGTGQSAAPSVDLNVSPDRGYLLVRHARPGTVEDRLSLTAEMRAGASAPALIILRSGRGRTVMCVIPYPATDEGRSSYLAPAGNSGCQRWETCRCAGHV
jgi:hypothetical protein